MKRFLKTPVVLLSELNQNEMMRLQKKTNCLILDFDNNECEIQSWVLNAVRDFEFPVITICSSEIKGDAFLLLQYCDIRICSEDTVFLTNNNTVMNADSALQSGFVNMVCKTTELKRKAEKFAEKIEQNAPFAVKNAKKAIKASLTAENQEYLEIENLLFSECFDSDNQTISEYMK